MARLIWDSSKASPLGAPPHFLLLPHLSTSFLMSLLRSITHLVWVDGHASGESNHRDAVKSCGVGDGCRCEVVTGLWRVTHQDGIDLQRNGSEEKNCLSSWQEQRQDSVNSSETMDVHFSKQKQQASTSGQTSTLLKVFPPVFNCLL